jgi:glutathione synthase
MVIADPLDRLDPETDTTLGLIRAALRRGHRVRHCEIQDLAIAGGEAQALAAGVGEPKREWVSLGDHDAILFRTDPPVDRRYLDATLIIDYVSPATLLVNDPRGIRAVSEHLWALQFPDLCPATLVAADSALIHEFTERHQQCVIKPVDGHAGRGVLRLNAGDPNRASIIELLTGHGQRAVVVQEWIAAVRDGNKRIFMHNGEPAGAAIRYPIGPDFRIGMPAAVAGLTERDREICDRIGPGLRALGLVLAGLDVIGGYLIEVNVTSSGALHKSDRLLGTSLCDGFIELVETITPRGRKP